MKKVNLFVLITLLTTVSCVSQEKYDELLTRVKVLENQNIYKSEIVFNFVYSCVNEGETVENCSCMMDGLMKKMSQGEYIKEETKLELTGEFSDNFIDIMSEVRSDCL
jgi:hypothetical protein|tara:strand:+ start:141 stop:464 length:324 start_codon:yes stop_codon:yes gene_type:complete